MSVKYLTNMSDTSNVKGMSVRYMTNVCRMSAECFTYFLCQQQICRMSVRYLIDVCLMSDKQLTKYVRYFLCQPNIRQMPVEYLKTMSPLSVLTKYLPNVCQISDECLPNI